MVTKEEWTGKQRADEEATNLLANKLDVGTEYTQVWESYQKKIISATGNAEKGLKQAVASKAMHLCILASL